MIKTFNDHNLFMEIWGLLFDVGVSIRYHDRRRCFFYHVNKISKMLIAITSSGAVISFIESFGQFYIKGFLAVLAILSVVHYLYKFSEKSKLHRCLREEFIHLEQEINSVQNPTNKMVAQFKKTRSMIEEKELPILKSLHAICYNEETRSRDCDILEMIKINWYQRLFRQLKDINPHTLQKYSFTLN